MRAKIEEALGQLAHDLQHSPEMQARVDRLKLEIIDNPAMQAWLDGLWESGRHALLRFARAPGGVRRGRLG